MKYTLASHSIEISDFQHDQIVEKIKKLEKHLPDPLPLEIAFTHDSPEVVRCHLNYGNGKNTVHCEQTGATIEDALDQVIEKLRRELIKRHEKKRDWR